MVTVNMIEERLAAAGCSVVFMPACRSQRFRHLALLGDGDDRETPAPEDLEGEVLFCGNPAHMAALLAARPRAWGLCVYGVRETFELAGPLQERVVLCRTPLSLHAVFARLQRLFFSMEDWTRRMGEALLKGGDYQSLLNVSERVLGNFVTVSNSEFRLLAYTQHVPIDDPVAQELVRLGFHPPQAIENFRKHHVMKGWETQTRIECRPADFTAYPTLDYVFRMRGSYFLHVVMQCNNRPVTAGLVDEFQLLIDHVEHCAKQDYHARFLLADEPSHLFEDLILRRPVGKGELARRARALELPSEGRFVLLALYFSEGGSESQFLAYHAQHAKEAFPHCFVGVHGLYVLVLDASGNAPESLAPPVQAFANAHPCTVGASETFSSLQDFAFAFQQAKKAVEMAMGLRPSLAARYEEKPSAPSVHRFGDCFAAYVAEAAKASSHLVEHSARGGIVPHIVRFDEQHGTGDARLLYCYLRNERNARITCEELFLHRSTLLYRIERMQERFGFSLDDAATRQRILAEYLVLPAD